MTAAPDPPAGPPLWSGLSVEDIHELIRGDVAELKRLHARKSQDDLLPAWKRDMAIRHEIAAIEHAHDQHFAWLKEIEARTSRR